MDGEDVILLVEDNPIDEKLIRLALKENEINNPIVVARDGVEALDYIFARGNHANRDVEHPPAVVLLDLQLPKIDGLEVLRRIRADSRTSLQPVVIFTASDEHRDRLKGYELGTNSFVCKPVDYDHFSNAVAQLGEYWTSINQIPPARGPETPVIRLGDGNRGSGKDSVT